MMKWLVALLAFGSISAFASDQVKICSNLMSVRSISELEAKSYVTRGYQAVSSAYIRVALNQVLNHLNEVESALTSEVDPMVTSIKETVIFEIQDSKNYLEYRISTSSRIFNKLAQDISVLEKANSCLE